MRNTKIDKQNKYKQNVSRETSLHSAAGQKSKMIQLKNSKQSRQILSDFSNS